MAESNTPKFTKSDFLKPAQVAEKYNLSTEEATKLMAAANKLKKRFKIGNVPHEMVYDAKWSHNTSKTPHHYRLHPLAIAEFEEFIAQRMKEK